MLSQSTYIYVEIDVSIEALSIDVQLWDTQKESYIVILPIF